MNRLGPSHASGLCHQTAKVSPTPMNGQRAASASLVGETGKTNAKAPKSEPAPKTRQMVIMAVVIVKSR